MDEVEVGAYNINKTKTKFSFGGSNLGSKRGQKPPEKPAKVSKLDTMASAEEKFDAIFGAPARKLLLLVVFQPLRVHYKSKFMNLSRVKPKIFCSKVKRRSKKDSKN